MKGRTVEATKRTSKNWCSCGFKNRGNGNHEEGTHHKAGKKVVEVVRGVKTNVGDPGDNMKSKK